MLHFCIALRLNCSSLLWMVSDSMTFAINRAGEAPQSRAAQPCERQLEHPSRGASASARAAATAVELAAVLGPGAHLPPLAAAGGDVARAGHGSGTHGSGTHGSGTHGSGTCCSGTCPTAFNPYLGAPHLWRRSLVIAANPWASHPYVLFVPPVMILPQHDLDSDISKAKKGPCLPMTGNNARLSSSTALGSLQHAFK